MTMRANSQEPKACTHPGCDRKDLRGNIGLSMHLNRSHRGKNWSTKPKATEEKKA